MGMTAMKSVGALVAAAVVALSSCGDGKTASDPDANAETPKLVLDCVATPPLGTSLDVPGPGRATPEEAVEPYAEGMDLIAHKSGTTAVVYGVIDGEVVRQFQASKHDGGWWPDGYTECTRL